MDGKKMDDLIKLAQGSHNLADGMAHSMASLLSPPKTLDMNALAKQVANNNNVAKRICRQIAVEIEAFERTLNPNEELGARLVSTPDGTVLHIDGLEWRTIECICFTGRDTRGRPTRLFQHVSQLNFQLLAVPIFEPGPAKRIGFLLCKQFAT
jgi:Family of unknown function (DUF6173)